MTAENAYVECGGRDAALALPRLSTLGSAVRFGGSAKAPSLPAHSKEIASLVMTQCCFRKSRLAYEPLAYAPIAEGV